MSIRRASRTSQGQSRRGDGTDALHVVGMEVMQTESARLWLTLKRANGEERSYILSRDDREWLARRLTDDLT